MQSSEEINIVAPTRVLNKLTLDSEQQERRERQQRQEQQAHQRRKQQKRKRRQEAERLQQEKIKQQEEKQKKYDLPKMMFEEDSEQGIQFKRVVKKIKRMYPDQVNKHEVQAKKKDKFIVPDYLDDEDEESESGSDEDDSGSGSEQESDHKKSKKEKKVEKKVQKKEKRPVQKKPVQKKKIEAPVKKDKVKIEPKNDKKQHLVKEVSIRWWYALPEWPPADFDYEGKLKNLGYRVLQADKFKLEADVVNGLQKVMAVDGYLGVYKSKTKLIDVRPKQSAPTLRNFRSKSIEELTNILKKALNVQIEKLSKVKYQQRGEPQLLTQLESQLLKLKSKL